jgi:gas vesicle protein
MFIHIIMDLKEKSTSKKMLLGCFVFLKFWKKREKFSEVVQEVLEEVEAELEEVLEEVEAELEEVLEEVEAELEAELFEEEIKSI